MGIVYSKSKNQSQVFFDKITSIFSKKEDLPAEDTIWGRIVEIKWNAEEVFIKMSNNAFFFVNTGCEGYGTIVRRFRYVQPYDIENYNYILDELKEKEYSQSDMTDCPELVNELIYSEATEVDKIG